MEHLKANACAVRDASKENKYHCVIFLSVRQRSNILYTECVWNTYRSGQLCALRYVYLYQLGQSHIDDKQDLCGALEGQHMCSKTELKETIEHSFIFILVQDSHRKLQTFSVMGEVDKDLIMVKLFSTNSSCQESLLYLRKNTATNW